jgi:hypothetical protein
MAEHSHEGHGSEGTPQKSGAGRWVLIGFALIAGYFLLTEHRAHVFQYLLVLACPLLHFFHGHGGHGGHSGDDGKIDRESKHAGGSH